MITAYHRPQSFEEALALISRAAPRTLPLGGGTVLSHGQSDDVEVVDLQALGLSHITQQGNNLVIGAATPLQLLLEHVHAPQALRRALKLEAPLNIRNMSTLAGAIVACDGRSTLCTVLLALDAKLTEVSRSADGNAHQSTIRSLGDFLPLRPRILPGKLITQIEFPLNARLAFEYVSRTPADKPIICVALAQWPSGRTRPRSAATADRLPWPWTEPRPKALRALHAMPVMTLATIEVRPNIEWMSPQHWRQDAWPASSPHPDVTNPPPSHISKGRASHPPPP